MENVGQTIIPLLATFLLLAAPLRLEAETGNEELLWKGKEALEEVLLHASSPQCPLILLTDGIASSLSFHQVLGPGSQDNGGVVILGAENNIVGTNVTLSSLPLMIARAHMQRRISWCVMVVVASDDPAFLAAFAEMSDSGRLIVRGVRLLVLTRLDVTRIRTLLQEYWTFSMMDAIFLKVATTPQGNRYEIYTHLPYTSSGAQVLRLAKWSEQTFKIVQGEKLFLEKYKNFHGMSFNILWNEFPPYWMQVISSGNNGSQVTAFTGREYLVMQAIAGALNFSSNPLPDEGLNRIFERLRAREGLMWPVNLPILATVADEFDLGLFIEKSTLAFTMVKPSIKPTWQSIYYPLKNEVWISVAAAVLLVYAALMLMEYSDEYERLNAWLVTKQVLGTLLDEAISGELPVRNPSRLVLVSWLVSAFIFGTVYRSNLTAYLTVPKYPPRIETFADLVKAGKTLTQVKSMTFFESSFRRSKNKVLTEIAARIQYVETTMEGMQRSLTEGSAFLHERLYLKLMIEKHFTGSDGSTDLYVSQRSLLEDLCAYILIRDAPFKEDINNCILDLHSAGLIVKWTQTALDEALKGIRQQLKNLNHSDVRASDEEQTRPLTITHMQGPLVLYLACTIVALVVFVCEIACRVDHVILHSSNQELLLEHL